MKIKVRCIVPDEIEIDVREYWGFSEESWKELDDHDKKYLAEGLVRLRMRVEIEEVDSDSLTEH